MSANKNLNQLKKTYAELGAEIAKLEGQTPEECFAQLVEGYEVKTDWEEYPNWLFFFKNGKILGEFSLETQTFYASYPNLWKVFANEFEMKNTDIQRFMSKQVEEHFKLRESETKITVESGEVEVEEHFKLK